MKNLFKAVGISIIVILALIGASGLAMEAFGTDHKQQRIDDCVRELDAYHSYYTAVETLLDSIPVDVDSPILETDAGSDYLNAKAYLDSIYDSNHKYGLRLNQKVVEHTNRIHKTVKSMYKHYGNTD